MKNITIKDRKSAENFLKALENAENKGAKKVKLTKMVEEVKDSEKIKRIFAK